MQVGKALEFFEQQRNEKTACARVMAAIRESRIASSPRDKMIDSIQLIQVLGPAALREQYQRLEELAPTPRHSEAATALVLMLILPLMLYVTHV